MGAGTCQQCQHAACHTGSGHSDMPHILSHGNIYWLTPLETSLPIAVPKLTTHDDTELFNMKILPI